MPLDRYPKIRWGDIKNHKKWRRDSKLFDGKDGEKCERLAIRHPRMEDYEVFIQVNGKNLDGKENSGNDWFTIHDSVLLGGYVFIGFCCGLHEGVTIGSGVSIEKHSRIFENASIGINSKLADWVNIGKNTIIENDVCIGKHVNIGNNTIIKTGCTIDDYCSVGSNVILRNQLICLKGSVYMVYLHDPANKLVGIFDEVHAIEYWKKYYKKIFRSPNFSFGEDQIIEYKQYIDLFDRILST